MVCPRCKSMNVVTQVVTDVRTKRRGCLGWLFWIILAICTFGLILIIPAATNTKTQTTTHTECVCQNCGYRWRL